MKFTAIVSGVFALAKAVPLIDKWIRDFIQAFIDKDMQESDSIRETVKQEKKALDRAIAEAKDDEQIKYLSITLRRLNNGGLPDKNTSKVL